MCFHNASNKEFVGTESGGIFLLLLLSRVFVCYFISNTSQEDNSGHTESDKKSV